LLAHRVRGPGAIARGGPVDGLAVCTAPIEQVAAFVATDGARGGIVTWLDDRNNLGDRPFTQHVLASGAVDPNWPVNGRALTQSSPAGVCFARLEVEGNAFTQRVAILR
jgi:hypothetical protein